MRLRPYQATDLDPLLALWWESWHSSALFAWACSRCPDGLTLKTLAENMESRAFYKSLGMTERGRSINDFNGREEVEYAL